MRIHVQCLLVESSMTWPAQYLNSVPFGTCIRGAKTVVQQPPLLQSRNSESLARPYTKRMMCVQPIKTCLYKQPCRCPQHAHPPPSHTPTYPHPHTQAHRSEPPAASSIVSWQVAIASSARSAYRQERVWSSQGFARMLWGLPCPVAAVTCIHPSMT